MLKLEIINETEEKVDLAIFSQRFARFKDVMEMQQEGNIVLVLVDDEKIMEINRDFRAKDEATDVISFAYLEDTELVNQQEPAVGDMFISLDTAKRQGEEKKHGLEKELEILFVHGLLHMFGFDHNNDEEEEEMEGWAKKILAD